ncbi:histidine kinase [Phenylobacterium sp.]|uniref:sensor histidine kinase n=1 Tax=Phenylobacterium sp. TaxID=1871053 RepID=UPI0025DB813B|nr:histidine kinase [Phenylobacterium sp.]
MLARTDAEPIGSTDYRSVFSALPTAMALVSNDERATRILGVTDRFAALLGARTEDLEGRDLAQVFPQRSAARVGQAVAASTEAQQSVMTRVALPRGERLMRLDVEARPTPEGVLLAFADAVRLPSRVAPGKEANPALAIARAEQNERRRVGRELHDCTSQLLVAAQLGLSALERRTELKGETRRIAADVRRSIAAALKEIRTFSFLLHPPGLSDGGLPKALEEFGAGFGSRTGLRIDVEVGPGPWVLPATLEMAMFRVAQEALMNVHRHAAARRATVRLSREASAVVLEVEDDGVGLRRRSGRPSPPEPLGVGLSGMLARMTHLGGSLTLEEQRRGLKVRAWAPVAER